MRDDINPPNLGKATETYDKFFFFRSYRDLEIFLSQLLKKGPMTVSDLTADSITAEDITITGPIVIDGLGNGIVVHVGAGSYAARTLTGTTNQITLVDGDGVSGNPVISITTNPTLPGDVTLGGGTNISPDSSASGQLKINGSGYAGYTALDATGMHIGHNSAVRNLTLDINETTAATLNANGFNSTPVGQSTPAAGSFTTLSSTGAATLATTLKVGPGSDTSSVPGVAALVTNNGTTVTSVRNSTADVETYWGVSGTTGFIGTLGSNAFTIFSNDADRASFHATTGVMSILSGGIQFPATQIASGDANTLDDYEEGTFTPTLFFGGAQVGMTFATQSAYYVKIGRNVWVNGAIGLTAKGSSTGAATITALPFSVSIIGAVPVSVASFVNGAALTSTPTGTASTTTISLFDYGAAGQVAMDDTNFGNTTAFRFSLYYWASG